MRICLDCGAALTGTHADRERCSPCSTARTIERRVETQRLADRVGLCVCGAPREVHHRYCPDCAAQAAWLHGKVPEKSFCIVCGTELSGHGRVTFCATHAAYARQAKWTRANAAKRTRIDALRGGPRVCPFPGCGVALSLHQKKWCSAHAKDWVRRRLQGRVCQAEGCGVRVGPRGKWCPVHRRARAVAATKRNRNRPGKEERLARYNAVRRAHGAIVRSRQVPKWPLKNEVVCLPNGCWVLATGLSSLGRVPTKSLRAVRRFFGGAIVPHYEFDHVCPGGPDRRCVNPNHLDYISHAEHVRRSALIRFAKGWFTPEEVALIEARRGNSARAVELERLDRIGAWQQEERDAIEEAE